MLISNWLNSPDNLYFHAAHEAKPFIKAPTKQPYGVSKKANAQDQAE